MRKSKKAKVKRQKLFLAIFFLLFTCHLSLFTPPAYAESVERLNTGAQLPDINTLKRIESSDYKFEWIKYQFSLGSSQPLENWISEVKKRNYKLLISVAKNQAGIETLKNPGKDYQFGQKPDVYSKEYCPWDEELESYTFPRSCTDSKGKTYSCPETIRSKPKVDNGYIKFRDKMKELAPRLNQVDAVEVWNEPNIADEWTKQGLGAINAQNYANFLKCGVKGLKKGGYTGTIISAALAPSAYTDTERLTSVNDLQFFNDFVAAGGLNSVDAIGWHINLTKNIPPTDKENPDGFYRVNNALGKGKPVWVTEFGWARDLAGINRETQSRYVSQAFQAGADIGEIQTMIVWNFGFALTSGTDPKYGQWDVEGTQIQTEDCNPRRSADWEGKTFGNPSDKYVAAWSLNDDAKIAKVAGQALLPKEANYQLTPSPTQQIETKADIKKAFDNSFIDVIQGLICAALPISTDFCTSYVSMGIPDVSTGTPDNMNRGKNTEEFSGQAKVLRDSAVPKEADWTPEKKDCNIGNFSNSADVQGDQKISDIDTSMGRTSGFYGNELPDFKTLTPEEYNKQLDARSIEENANLANKPFGWDLRVPDTDQKQDDYYKANYPNDIKPLYEQPN